MCNFHTRFASFYGQFPDFFPTVGLTVEAEQARYESEFRGDVVMGCRFQPKLSNPLEYLKVTWHWIGAASSREVYQKDNSPESLASQHPDYEGRVTFFTEELQEGWAKIKVHAPSEAFGRRLQRQVTGPFPVGCPQSDVVILSLLLAKDHSTLSDKTPVTV